MHVYFNARDHYHELLSLLVCYYTTGTALSDKRRDDAEIP